MNISNVYPEPLDKLALALESAQVAKAIEVANEGIGEDLRINLMGWQQSKVIAIAQLMDDPESRWERVKAVSMAAQVLRAGFHADAFTIILEGFCLLDQKQPDDPDFNMAEAFARGDKNVSECLVAVTVDSDAAFIGLSPYAYKLGRVVEYGEPMIFPPASPDEGAYPSVLHRTIIDTDFVDPPEDAAVFYKELSSGLRQRSGFVISWSSLLG